MTLLTPRIVAFVLGREAIGLDAYKDSKGIWTWAAGLTAAAGVKASAYINHPAPLEECLRATVAHMRATYLPAVVKAFDGHGLNDAQVAAALSFEWNTGEIGVAHWVRDWKAGNPAFARVSIVADWSDHDLLKARRELERDLFFNSTWPADMRVPVFKARQISYLPGPSIPTDVMPLLTQILAAA